MNNKKKSRSVTSSTKMQVACRQYGKCANRPGSNLKGIGMYLCPLWKDLGENKGCFDGACYHIDHIIEHSVSRNDSMENLQALCPTCHDVKTKSYMCNRSKKTNTCSDDDEPVQFLEYVDSDYDCQVKLFELEGSDKFKYCKKTLYIFDEKNGMFTTDIEMLYYYMNKNSAYLNIVTGIFKNGNVQSKNYSKSTILRSQVIPFIKTAALDNDWLQNSQSSSLQHLLFKNGIYNMKTKTFSKSFDPNIVFHARIQWDFPERNKKEIKKAREISFDAIFENPEPMIAALARALAGDYKLKKFYFCPGRTNAGKSKLAKMLEFAFGDYIGSFNAESLACVSGNDTRDEAAKMRWALQLQHCRILLSNEVNMNKKLDGNAIKKNSSGGDKLVGRGHHQVETAFRPHYTIFCMLNDIPKIEPMDEAVVGRLEYIEFPYAFVASKNLNIKPYNKLRDDEIDGKIESEKFVRGFIHIILDGYEKYKDEMPEFDADVKDKWLSDNKQNIETIDLIKTRFVITGDLEDTITVAEMKNFKNNNRTLATMSLNRFTEILQDDLHLIKSTKKNDRVWKGIKNL